MIAISSVATPTHAISHMCQINANPTSALSAARMKPAPVFLGIWMGMNPFSGRTYPFFFMSSQVSLSYTTGVNAKLYAGGGEDVDHSRVRPSHGSPVVSRSASRLRKLTSNWMRNDPMPKAMRKAPKAAISNQMRSDGSSKWLKRRVTPIKPRMYNGMNANQNPTSQNQNEHLPQNGSSL